MKRNQIFVFSTTGSYAFVTLVFVRSRLDNWDLIIKKKFIFLNHLILIEPPIFWIYERWFTPT